MTSNGRLSALYYPYTTPRSIDKIKKALLIFDHIYLIIPTYADTYRGLGIERGSSGNFREMHYSLDEPIAKGVFRIIRPADTVKEFSESMIQALMEDQQDPRFQAEANNQLDWLIYVDKVPEGLYEVFSHPSIRQYRDIDSNILKFPFAIGESIMISHALYACHAKREEGEFISPITDEPLHKKILRYRLERGAKNVESKTGMTIANSQYIRKAFDIAIIPTPPGTIQQVIDLRTTHEVPLRKIRNCIKKLAALMQNQSQVQDYAFQVSAINDDMYDGYQELGLSFIPNSREVIRPTDNTYGTVSAVVGGWAQLAIGISLEPAMENGLVTVSDTEVSRKIISNVSNLQPPDIAYELATAT